MEHLNRSTSFECFDCSKSFTRNSSLKRHLKNTHPTKYESFVLQSRSRKTYKYSCNECNNNFNTLHHLNFHKKQKHTSMANDIKNHPKELKKSFSCSECNHHFSFSKTLYRHMRHKHPGKHSNSVLLMSRPVKSFKYNCDKCSAHFNKLYHFNNHKRNKHCVSMQRKIKFHKCPMCSSTFERKYLLTHYQVKHDVKIEQENLTFPTYEEFCLWKETIEKETKCKFVVERGAKVCKNIEYQTFKCHRSGYVPLRSRKKRHLKTQGSKKINHLCPAGITVSKRNGTVNVRFRKTHIGHHFDLGHLHLTLTERQALAEKLAAKIPFDAILDDVRNSISETGRERLHLLTKKDLHNIQKSFNLGSDVMKHENDAISVDVWVQEMLDSPNPCVLFYKSQGSTASEFPELKNEDFMLIIMNDVQKMLLKKHGSKSVCIDGTHGLNAYNFELVTLLIIDEINEGFPCAFLFTNRVDEDTLSIFLKYIKNEVGIIETEVFMSDMAESFINAWKNIMCMPKRRVFCTWHVDRAFRKNLNKIKCKYKKVETYKLLRTLLEERDKNAFEIMIQAAVKKLCEDEDTALYGIYFRDHYVKRATAWAFCYRLHCGLNTNMHLERMHRTIKYMYLQGKTVKRLDKSIHGIMRFLKNKIVERLILFDKGKISTKLKEIRKRHKSCLDLNTTISEKDGIWSICSSSRNEIYHIEERNSNCSCRLICIECKCCIHKFVCTCHDSSIKWNMCKHIHTVCMYRNERNVSSDLIESENLCNENSYAEADFLVMELSKQNRQSSRQLSVAADLESLKKEYVQFFNDLSTKEELSFLKKNLLFMKSSVAAMKNSKQNFPFGDITNKEPSNKKIEPQRKLFSTKKKQKRSAVTILKPTAEESDNIALSLLTQNEKLNFD